jgi:hypothetical protein
MTEFVLDEALSQAEAPDRVYRAGDLVFKVKVIAKGASLGATKFGRAAYRVTASLCNEQAKAQPFEGGHAIAAGVNLTLQAHADLDIAVAFEDARQKALEKAFAAATLHAQL